MTTIWISPWSAARVLPLDSPTAALSQASFFPCLKTQESMIPKLFRIFSQRHQNRVFHEGIG